VDDAPQQIGALLRATAASAVAVAAVLHLSLCPLELIIGDQRLVALICLDPFLSREQREACAQ
jgi:hypothetical protein